MSGITLQPVTTGEMPYVISSDLAEIFTEWGGDCGVHIPSRQYFLDRVGEIAEALGTIFPDVRIVDDTSIIDLFRMVSNETTAPIISIDKIYMSSVLGKNYDAYMNVTRAVDNELNIVGLISRPVSWQAEGVIIKPYEETVSAIAQTYNARTITLVDDVVFSGGTISQIVDSLKKCGVEVASVVAGISIGQAKEALASRGIQLRSAYHFTDVIDEICCRDFIIGAPYGGRTVVKEHQANGMSKGLFDVRYAPYILPLGQPVKWATIPEEQARDFSIRMMDIASKIWGDIQDLNQRTFSTRDLGCRVYGLPDRPSVIEAIQEIKGALLP